MTRTYQIRARGGYDTWELAVMLSEEERISEDLTGRSLGRQGVVAVVT
jgi:hypothetical protein